MWTSCYIHIPLTTLKAPWVLTHSPKGTSNWACTNTYQALVTVTLRKHLTSAIKS